MNPGILDIITSAFQSATDRPWNTLLEMLLIGVVVYAVLRFLHGTRGARLLQGLAILIIAGLLMVRVVADHLNLERIRVLYEPFVWTVLFTTLVVFQPELRRGLMRLGETRFRWAKRSEIEQIIAPIAAACASLSKNKIGALIAIEQEVGLNGVIEQGVPLDATLTAELLNTIFWPGSALHDLGVVVQRGRVAAAACPFPLGDADGLDRSTGSRHRAALGLSVETDALVVVVSEETGTISIAERGRLDRGIPADGLANALRRRLTAVQAPGPRIGAQEDGLLASSVQGELTAGEGGFSADGPEPREPVGARSRIERLPA